MIPVKTTITEPEEYEGVYQDKKHPHTCPICSGKGIVPVNFYEHIGTSITPVQCRGCMGTGIVWG